MSGQTDKSVISAAWLQLKIKNWNKSCFLFSYVWEVEMVFDLYLEISLNELEIFIND